jgi:ribosomal protein L17
MNDVRQLFQDIKSVFAKEGVKVEAQTTANETTTTEITEEKFEDVTLADGSIAQVEPDVSLGAAMVIQIEDELLPAPTGDYELADGRVVSVEDGVIVAVAEPELEEVEEAPAEEVVEEEVIAKEQPTFTPEQRKEAKKIIESIITEKHFASVNDTKKLNVEVTALKDAFHKLVELTETLMEQPSTSAIKKNNSGYSRLKKGVKKDIITRIKERNIIN